MTTSPHQGSINLTLEKITKDFDYLTFVIKQKESVYSLLPSSISEKQMLCTDLLEIVSEDTLEYNALISSIAKKTAKKILLSEQISKQENTESCYPVLTLIRNLENEILTEELNSDVLQQSISVQTAEQITLLENINIEIIEYQDLEPEIIILKERLELLSQEISSIDATRVISDTKISKIDNADSVYISSPDTKEESKQNITLTLSDQERPLDQVIPSTYADVDLKTQLVIHKKAGNKQIIDAELVEITSKNAIIKTTTSLRTHIKISLKLLFHSNTGNIEIPGKIISNTDRKTYCIRFKEHQNEAVVSLLSQLLEDIVYSNQSETLETSSPLSAKNISIEEELTKQESLFLSSFSDDLEDDLQLDLDDLENNRRRTIRYVRDDIAAHLIVYKLIGKSKPINVELLDVSSKGALINAPGTKFGINTKVDLELIFKSDSRPFTITGTIVRKTEDMNVGIKFSSYQNDLGDHLLDTHTDLVFR